LRKGASRPSLYRRQSIAFRNADLFDFSHAGGCWRLRVWNRCLLSIALGRAELDLHTLIWTRAGAFPLTSLEFRLKCPMCGSRRVSVIFDVPSEPAAMRIAGMPSR